MQQPQQPSADMPSPTQGPMGMQPTAASTGMSEPSNKELGIEDNVGPTPEEIDAHLDNLPDEAKAFLAEHLTPEFVTAIGFISGQEVANHLMKYADQDKVLVPVPRKVAEENLAALKAQAGGQQPQAAPAQAQPAPAPQGGMMAPMQQTATPQ